MIFVETREPLLKAYYSLFLNAKINADTAELLSNQLTEDACAIISNENIEIIKGAAFNERDIVELSRTLFNFNNFNIYLSNFLNTMLSAKQYGLIFVFFNKAFVSHIGNSPYTNKNINSYDMAERTFVRMVEALRTCGIFPANFLPFLLNVLEADFNLNYSKWKRPVFDFLSEFTFANQRDFFSFIIANFKEFGVTGFKFLKEIKMENTTERLIDLYLTDDNTKTREVRMLLQETPKQVTEYLIMLINKNDQRMRSITELLISFKDNAHVREQLIAIYRKEKDDKIRKAIVENIEVPVENIIKQEFQVTQYAEKLVRAPVEQFLGLSYDCFPGLTYVSGKTAPLSVNAFILSCYKNLCSVKAYKELAYFKDLLNADSLDAFVKFVFERILNDGFKAENEHYMLLICQNSSQNALKEVFTELLAFFDESLSDGFAMFLTVFALARPEMAGEALCLFDDSKQYGEELKIMLVRALESCGKCKASEIEKIKDSLEPAYKLNEDNAFIIDTLTGHITIRFKDDYTLGVSFPQGLTIDDYDSATKTQVDTAIKNLALNFGKQLSRLISAFETGRKFKQEELRQMCSGNSIFCFLAERLLWGKYKGEKLTGIFIIQNGKFVDIKPGENAFDLNYTVGLLHPLEYLASEYLTNAVKQPMPFNQINRDVFFIDNFEPQAAAVLKFNGLFVAADKFVKRLLDLGWKTGAVQKDGKITSFLKLNKELGLSAEIEITPVSPEPSHESAVLGALRFYKTPKEIKTGQGFADKTVSLAIHAVPDRFFSDTLYELALAGKK